MTLSALNSLMTNQKTILMDLRGWGTMTDKVKINDKKKCVLLRACRIKLYCQTPYLAYFYHLFPVSFKRSLCFPSVIFQEIPKPFSRNRWGRQNNRFPKRYPLCQGHVIIRSLSLSLSPSHLAHPYQRRPSQQHRE